MSHRLSVSKIRFRHRGDGLFNVADGRLAGVKRPLSRVRGTAARDPQQTKASRASANKNVAILKCSAEGWTDLHGASLGLER